MNSMDLFGGMQRSADFSPCRTWRYSLIRVWDETLPLVVFVLLNPSTADEHHDDPTNRRGIKYAAYWEYGSVVFVNLFAIRSPDPKKIKEVSDPVGPDNDAHILRWAEKADRIVCAWGPPGEYMGRDEHVLRLLAEYELNYLALTKDGHPNHPLYLKANLMPIVWAKR